MSNSFFDLFGIDLDTTLKNLVDLKNNLVDTYNNKVNDLKENMHKYDLNTEEGYTAFIKEAAEIRTKLLENDNVFSRKMVEVLDSFIEKAMREHSERMKENVETKKSTANDIINKEVERQKEENHSKLNVHNVVEEDNDNVDWPSSKLTVKQKRNVWHLVDQYMDEMIMPFVSDDINEDLVDDMASGLFEFAAWLLNK